MIIEAQRSPSVFPRSIAKWEWEEPRQNKMDKSKRLIQRGLRNKQRVGTYAIEEKRKKERKKTKRHKQKRNIVRNVMNNNWWVECGIVFSHQDFLSVDRKEVGFAATAADDENIKRGKWRKIDGTTEIKTNNCFSFHPKKTSNVFSSLLTEATTYINYAFICFDCVKTEVIVFDTDPSCT